MRGFTLVEILIGVALIALIAGIAVKALNPTPEARVIACLADLEAHHTLVEQAAEQTYPREPTWEEVKQIAGNRWKDHYHYVPNNSDPNSGHGNDIDICDEENPGASGENRSCLNLRYFIICDHDHYAADVKFNAFVESWYTPDPLIFPLDPIEGGKWTLGQSKIMQRGNGHEFLNDCSYWVPKAPNWQRWIQ